MTVPPMPFEPGMISSERRPIFDQIIGLTGHIQAEFVSTPPKPNPFKVQSVQEDMLTLDRKFGEALMMHGPQDLDEVGIKTIGKAYSEDNKKIFEIDPLTKGLIVGEPTTNAATRGILYNTPINGVFLLITTFDVVRGLKGTQSYIKSSLIGSNNPILKKNS